ncbi:MarR family winged helix-turn-helix transcriptional regulator [Nocardiopsis synnemataformans]|uniref:MarR family winged helix-turn-helix transcriptional regulator n=1 Tax=Nocardiopsis synnemataformans TaxID=61305 RepID=UPI003EC13598
MSHNQHQQPRWLGQEQSKAWIELAGMMIALPSTLDAQLQRDAGISHVEYQVLSWLSMSPERTARMSQIAEMAHVRLSHLSRIASRLEGRGWLRRRPDPDDGRATLAVLTDDGWDKVVATAPGHVEEVRRLVFDNLSATQVRQLQQIGHRVLEAIQPGYCPRLPPATADGD